MKCNYWCMWSHMKYLNRESWGKCGFRLEVVPYLAHTPRDWNTACLFETFNVWYLLYFWQSFLNTWHHYAQQKLIRFRQHQSIMVKCANPAPQKKQIKLICHKIRQLQHIFYFHNKSLPYWVYYLLTKVLHQAINVDVVKAVSQSWDYSQPDN